METLDNLQTVSASAERDGRRVRHLFGIPLLSVLWPDAGELNRQLTGLVLDLERTQPSVKQSNRGGWQSEKNLQSLRHPAIRTLLSWIDVGVYLISSELVGEDAVDRFPEKWRISAWANVNRIGHFNGIHYHVGGFWSGTYYVAVEGDQDERGSGVIGFRNPSQAGMVASNIQAPQALQQAFQQEIYIQPQPGLMLIFPSWLEHWVNAYAGTGPRISVAFDVAYQVHHGG